MFQWALAGEIYQLFWLALMQMLQVDGAICAGYAAQQVMLQLQSLLLEDAGVSDIQAEGDTLAQRTVSLPHQKPAAPDHDFMNLNALQCCKTMKQGVCCATYRCQPLYTLIALGQAYKSPEKQNAKT
eukprot:632612-Pelagomonas_calceolata.AAC.2